jgi:hypothetical protein
MASKEQDVTELRMFPSANWHEYTDWVGRIGPPPDYDDEDEPSGTDSLALTDESRID